MPRNPARLARRALKAALERLTTRHPPRWPDDPFVQGAYAPVDETPAPLDAEVSGRLPPGLRGVYLRNGPNPAHPPLGRHHWFDGDGLVHAVRIGDGRARYQSRFVRTGAFVAEQAAGRALWGGLLDPPWRSRPPKGMPRGKNPANTALLDHHDRLLALWEGGAPYALEPSDLSTIGRDLFDGALDHPLCAHPKVHPDGHLHGFGALLRPKPPYAMYSVFDAGGRRVTHRPIPLPEPVMMHDMALTDRFAIVLDLPQCFRLWRLFIGQSPFVFDTRRPARFGLMPRFGDGPVRWFEDDPCFVFHVAAAWEEKQTVVLLACRYPRFPGGLALGDGGGGDEAHLVEWRFDLDTGRTTRRQLLDTPVEFPRIAADAVARDPGVIYLLAGDQRALLRYDTRRGEVTRHAAPAGARFDEPCPVHGAVVALAIRADCGPSRLCIIDPERFGEPPVASIELPRHVPHGLHGLWLPGGS